MFHLEDTKLLVQVVDFKLELVFEFFGVGYLSYGFEHHAELGLDKVVADLGQSLVLFKFDDLVVGYVVDGKGFTEFVRKLFTILFGNHHEVSESLAGSDNLLALDDGLMVELLHLHDFSFLVFNLLDVEQILTLQLLEFLLQALLLVSRILQLLVQLVNLLSDDIQFVVQFFRQLELTINRVGALRCVRHLELGFLTSNSLHSIISVFQLLFAVAFEHWQNIVFDDYGRKLWRDLVGRSLLDAVVLLGRSHHLVLTSRDCRHSPRTSLIRQVFVLHQHTCLSLLHRFHAVVIPGPLALAACVRRVCPIRLLPLLNNIKRLTNSPIMIFLHLAVVLDLR